jgi:hypothetical protein
MAGAGFGGARRSAILSWPATTESSTSYWTKQAELEEGEGHMHNQHAGLSQVLADQHITQRRQQATQARLGRGTRPHGRRRRSRAAHGWWQLARWPAVAAQQPAHRPHRVS